MKTSNLSRITLLCGLALGIMVLWAGASPIAEGADLLIGGWSPYSGCKCCDTTEWDDCYNGPWYCAHESFEILILGTSGGGEPESDRPACRTSGNDAGCFNMHHSCCYCCTP